MMAAEAACVAASDGCGAERGQRDRRRSNANVEGPETVSRLETVEAFIIDFLGLSLEILRRPKLSNKAALGLESAIDIDPSVATKILVHLVACRISALVRLIRGGLR